MLESATGLVRRRGPRFVGAGKTPESLGAMRVVVRAAVVGALTELGHVVVEAPDEHDEGADSCGVLPAPSDPFGHLCHAQSRPPWVLRQLKACRRQGTADLSDEIDRASMSRVCPASGGPITAGAAKINPPAAGPMRRAEIRHRCRVWRSANRQSYHVWRGNDAEPALGWTFLTNHARVLALIARDPGARVRDIAARSLLTERAVQRIIADLEQAGYLVRTRQGRGNRYDVTAGTPLRHPADAGPTVAELLAMFLPPGSRASTDQSESDAPA